MNTVRRFFTALTVTFFATSASLTAQENAITHVHDPAITKEGETYYLFTTGRGVPIRTSPDLKHWTRAGRVFEESVPAWTRDVIEGAKSLWAPDIAYFNDRFHLYYSVSTFGSQRSLIGLATTQTLDPASPDYGWTDHGKVVDSQPGRDGFNAIDANVALDEAGKAWLSWGSFHWGPQQPAGIVILPLNNETGMPVDGTEPKSIAARPEEHALEAPCIVRRGDYYYLFISFDLCCRGEESTYKIMVGRSENIDGPYADREGKPMVEGGATLLLESRGNVRGPGHNDVLVEGDDYWLVHHFYNANQRGTATLQIRPLTWDADGWPIAGAPIFDPPLED